ncbi:unnamed protein product [Victoria cruziana]
MAPNPNKPYRVCDNCYGKIKKTLDNVLISHPVMSRRGSMHSTFSDAMEKDDKFDIRSQGQVSRFSSIESFKQAESRYSSKRNKKLEFSSSRVSPIPSSSNQWSTLAISRSFNPVFGSSKKFFSASVPGSRIVSRATSPISRRPSPPRSTTPTPTLGGLTSPKVVVDDAKKTNDNLSQEVLQLRAQVENLNRKSQLLEVELERTTKQLKEAVAIAGEETAKCKAAKEVIKSLTAQLKDMAERLPVGAVKNSKVTVAGLYTNSSSPTSSDASVVHAEEASSLATGVRDTDSNGNSMSKPPIANGPAHSSVRSINHNRLSNSDIASRNAGKSSENHEHEGEWVEQDEPGVYITLTSLPGGGKDLKRVRFSRKRFSERQAEQWWKENRARVYEQYNVCMVEKSSIGVGHDDASH